MKGLRYQLKSVLHDKFCLMTFLLPIVVAVALNFVGAIDFSTLGELHFGVLKGNLLTQTVTWLERYGPVTAYPTVEELTDAIKEPSTNLIGVEAASKQFFPATRWTYFAKPLTRSLTCTNREMRPGRRRFRF